MAYANYMQHHLPQPVPRAWCDETGRDMGQHEIELRAHLGVWVCLTAQILLVLLFYHTLSVFAAATGKHEAQAHAAAPACLGLGLVVYGLFFFFYLLDEMLQPDVARPMDLPRVTRRALRALDAPRCTRRCGCVRCWTCSA